MKPIAAVFSCLLLASPYGAFIVQDDEKDNTSHSRSALEVYPGSVAQISKQIA